MIVEEKTSEKIQQDKVIERLPLLGASKGDRTDIPILLKRQNVQLPEVGWTDNTVKALHQRERLLQKFKNIGKGYLLLPEEVIKNNCLTKEARLLYTILSRLNDKTEGSSINLDNVSHTYKIFKTNTIIKYLNELQEHKILEYKVEGLGYNQILSFVFGIKQKTRVSEIIVTDVLLETSELEVNEKAFLLLILPYVLENDVCQLTKNEMSERTGVPERTIKRILHSLNIKSFVETYARSKYIIKMTSLMQIGIK